MSARRLSCLLLTLVALPAFAAAPEVKVDTPPDCLPLEYNRTLVASVSPEVAGSSVRLYFRRLNPVGAFYYDETFASGDGGYWTVFPKPEDRKQHLLTDDWWEVLQGRDWMEGHDREWLEDWLEERDQEAAEYYVAVYDAGGELLGRTPTSLVEVWPADRCHEPLTPVQTGWAENLTVGETTEVQARRCLFHWLCDGIVTRIDFEGILRPDECCRACVVAGILPQTAGAVVLPGIITQRREGSPEQP
jgi:hypothetical protein